MRTENGKLATAAFACASRQFDVLISLRFTLRAAFGSLSRFARLSFQFSVFSPLILLLLITFPHLQAASINEANSLTITQPFSGIESLRVFAKGSSQPLFGTFRPPVFVPAIPFVRGQIYEVELKLANGSESKFEVTFDQAAHVVPTVRLSPTSIAIPANTLKLYLDFSKPMEEGVFLKHITLQRQNTGEEVAGAFRETELWSPDGKRLTIMFHPGRQKTGVNLNLDEGPVLIAGEGYDLVVSGQWRSTAGIALGRESAFHLTPIAADHEQPDPARWQIHPPKAGTLAPIVVITNELFDPQIFARALQVPQTPGKAEAKVIDLQRVEWRFTPEQPWKPGEHCITIDPELEDLAGNNLRKPFEVDLTVAPPQPRSNVLKVQIQP